MVAQGDPGFPALYSGPNSLNKAGERQETLAADLFAGVRLWSGAEMHVDALMWQGHGDISAAERHDVNSRGWSEVATPYASS